MNLTPLQKNNLLQFLNRVDLKGIDEANAFMEVLNLIQNAEETTCNTQTPVEHPRNLYSDNLFPKSDDVGSKLKNK